MITVFRPPNLPSRIGSSFDLGPSVDLSPLENSRVDVAIVRRRFNGGQQHTVHGDLQWKFDCRGREFEMRSVAELWPTIPCRKPAVIRCIFLYNKVSCPRITCGVYIRLLWPDFGLHFFSDGQDILTLNCHVQIEAWLDLLGCIKVICVFFLLRTGRGRSVGSFTLLVPLQWF